MILDIRPDMAFAFRPLLAEMVEREAARGDTMNLDEWMGRLEAGAAQLVSFTAGPDDIVPLLLLLLRGHVDHLRDRNYVWVYNLFVPNPERLYERWDRADVGRFLSSYPNAEVQFQTSNPAVLGMLRKLGFAERELHTVYSLEAANG